MKPIPIILSPTRNRALNMFLGLALSLASVLLFLALATYHPADPSMNTASGADPALAIHNWIGLFGAYTSDILFQAFGITAFLFPLWIGGLGWNWIRSRSGGSAILRWMGTTLTILFLPSVLGLFPWHWHWMHAVPVEGVMGRVISGTLVVYLNIQGAWLVSAAFAAVGVYFASDINFWKLKTQIEDHWLTLVAWHDRYQNWREDRAERKRELVERLAEQTQPGPAQRLFSGAIGDADQPPPAETPPARQRRRFATLFGMKRRVPEPDPVDEIPAFQRATKSGDDPGSPATSPGRWGADPIPPRRSSIWERTVADSAAPVAPVPVALQPPRQPSPDRSQSCRNAPQRHRRQLAPAPGICAPVPPPAQVAHGPLHKASPSTNAPMPMNAP